MYTIIIIFLNSKLFVIFILFFFSELRETFRLLAFGAIFRLSAIPCVPSFHVVRSPPKMHDSVKRVNGRRTANGGPEKIINI